MSGRILGDTFLLAAVLTVAIALRLAFAQHAPVLATGDSETYLAPSVALERGSGLDLSIKRTPGYPVVVAGVLRLSGEDLRVLAAAQHGLGVVSTALTYILTRTLAGRVAAAFAGLGSAVAGNLIIYERLIMTECLFAVALLATLV